MDSQREYMSGLCRVVGGSMEIEVGEGIFELME